LARAHDLRTVLHIGHDTVKVEAGYDDDTPAEKARVLVTDGAGETVAAGVLDERGLWVFPRPQPGEYVVVVESAGHRDRLGFTITAPVAEAGPIAYTSWRLDKRLGLAIGLVLLLGGTVALRYVRRAPRILPESASPDQ
jgi:hypothetical protein